MERKLSLWQKIKRLFGDFAIFFKEMEKDYNEKCKRKLADGTGAPSAYVERG